MKKLASVIEMIPIESISVVNPRDRNARIHRAVTKNIEDVGLKRPITVRRISEGESPAYALICGQGRLESCIALGEEKIAALVVDVDEETGHVMSIVENVARRTPRAAELLEHVRSLKNRGHSDSEIAEKLGCTKGWASDVVNLLERGESRLLAATESGILPMGLAIAISRADEKETQEILVDAYARGDLKGRKITMIRKIVDQRMRSGKKVNNGFTKAAPRARMSSSELAMLYQRDTDRHRLIQKKAEIAQNALLVARQIFKELYNDPQFCSLLKSSGFPTIPQPLTMAAQGKEMV